MFTQAAAAAVVHRIIIEGVINPAATEYIIKSIEKAEEAEAELLVIEMDTPGGLMESMHRIMKAIQSSSVPVAVYVAPSGSRAGSAGIARSHAETGDASPRSVSSCRTSRCRR